MAAVAGLHVLGWGAMLLWIAPRYPVMLGLAGLAYTFGLRHALDAHMKRGHHDKASLEEHLRTGGLLTRIFGRLFRVIKSSWQMYPIGFLFGLGFDTASEVALLAISAGAAASHMPLLAVLSLPVIFAAGMSLMDTADGAFMSKAYSWAFANPKIGRA